MPSSVVSRPRAIVVFGMACVLAASACAGTSSDANVPSPPPPSDGPALGGAPGETARVPPTEPSPAEAAPVEDPELEAERALRARLLRERCRTELEDRVRRRGDGEVSGWRGDGDFRDESAQLRTLGGELLIRNRQGREVVHDYLCSFRTDRDDQLADVDYSRAGTGNADEELPLLLRTQCRSSVEALLIRREEGRVESWRGDGDIREASGRIVRVEGEMVLRPPQGRQEVHLYACSFRADQNYRLVDVDHRPGHARTRIVRLERTR